MKALQVALANLRDATKPIDSTDRIILLNHIEEMRNATLDEVTVSPPISGAQRSPEWMKGWTACKEAWDMSDFLRKSK